ncbi:hypothetical protein EZS27_024414, partial [termite gut metagenome]
FLVSEYGTKSGRPHYHMLLFNFPQDYDISRALAYAWPHGFFSVGEVTPASIHYTTKYVLGYANVPDYVDKPFLLCSRGIGSSYLTGKVMYWHRDGLVDYMVADGGFKFTMPRYYKDKLFDSEMKAVIAEKNLDLHEEGMIDKIQEDKVYDASWRGRIPRGVLYPKPYHQQVQEDYERKMINSLEKTTKLS